jgi:hypothetical protein
VNFSVRYTPTSGLLPHSGWAGATDTPGAVGDSEAAGYDANAIARADFVPYQTITGTYNAGVVAFHIEGIDYVKLAVDGGPWLEVDTPTLNSDTGVVEYHVPIVASRFADGLHEWRAIAYPVSGVPRVISGMFFSTNEDATLTVTSKYVATTGNDTTGDGSDSTPYATIGKAIDVLRLATALEGANVYLKAGTHTFTGLAFPASTAANSQRWLTVRPAPGLDKDDVTLKTAGSNETAGALLLVRLHDLSLVYDAGGSIMAQNTAGAKIWYSDCACDGLDRTSADANNSFAGGWPGGQYMTDCTITRVQNGPGGFALVRNVTQTELLSDAFGYGSGLVVNSSVSDLDPTDPLLDPSQWAHPDISQDLGPTSNYIMYGVTTPTTGQEAAQGLFLSQGISPPTTHTDIAIVDCDFSSGGGVGFVFSVDGTVTHFFVKDSVFRQGQSGWGAVNFTADNVVLESVSFPAGGPGAHAGVTFR